MVGEVYRLTKPSAGGSGQCCRHSRRSTLPVKRKAFPVYTSAVLDSTTGCRAAFFTLIVQVTPVAGCFGLKDDHHHARVAAERLLETRPVLDVFELYREGALVEGASVTLQMTGGGKCRATRTVGNLNLEGQLIPIRPHPRLPMPVFGCPRCGTDRYKLYGVRGIWACRDCHTLTWACRHTHRSVPGLHRIAWLRKRIKADPRPFTQLPSKPPHWRRYWRMAREIRRLEQDLIRHARLDVVEVLEQRYGRS
jgi:hypothetical protein